MPIHREGGEAAGGADRYSGCFDYALGESSGRQFFMSPNACISRERPSPASTASTRKKVRRTRRPQIAEARARPRAARLLARRGIAQAASPWFRAYPLSRLAEGIHG